MRDIDEASPPFPERVVDPVLLSPDEVVVLLFVEVSLSPVSPPRAPLPEAVFDPLSTLPPSPPFPVEPELPEPACERPVASPEPWFVEPDPQPQLSLPELPSDRSPVRAVADDWLSPVLPESPELPPGPALLLFVLVASPPLPPEPPSPVWVPEELELEPVALELPPSVVECDVEFPPIEDSVDMTELIDES